MPDPYGIHHIRPHRIFRLIEALPPERAVAVNIPYWHGAGGTSLLETLILIAASRVVGAKKIFEFGTFRGSNTLNFALNTPLDGEVLTLDLDEGLANQVQSDPADVPFKAAHLASLKTLDFIGSPVASKIKTLTGNSIGFDFSPWSQSVDLVFIDGGHDFLTVKSDTESAFGMAAVHKPSCIVWHDYGNPDYKDLSGHLDDLSRQLPIFHIEDTMLCAWFNDPGESILPRLAADRVAVPLP